MYPIHENSSGIFQELARKNDVSFGQLNYLVIKPKCSRGDHYHKRKEEWFICLRGRCELDITDIKNKECRKVIMDPSKKEFVKVGPFENHVLKNLSETKNCEVLIIVSEEFNPENPDTHKMGK